MSEYDIEVSAVMNPSATVEREPVSYHLDESEQIENEQYPVYLYIWDTETPERLDELDDTLSELRRNYTFATGIVYIEALRDLVPLESEQLTAYAWLSYVGEYPHDVDSETLARDLHTVQKHL